MAKRRRRRADPTVHWEQLELLCAWDELFALEEALGDTGWLKALALDGYAPRGPNFAVAIELPGGKARRRRLLKSWCGSGGKPCR